MIKKTYMYPIWLRVWHWINAFLFLALIISGASLHYSSTSEFLIPFQWAITTHNTAGILLSFNMLFYTIFNIATKNYKQYIPHMKGFFRKAQKQTRYYIYGVFKGEEHPFETDEKNKFNPLQQITYYAIMFFMCPTIIFTGILLFFPELAPDKVLGMGGVWPIALLHVVVGYLLSLFFVGHIYLATHGDTVTSNFKAMITGWHVHESHEHEPTEITRETINE